MTDIGTVGMSVTVALLRRVAHLLGAEPRGYGSWFATSCPVCEIQGSLSLTTRGAKCRWDGCRWATTDLSKVLELTIAATGRTHTEITTALRFVAA